MNAYIFPGQGAQFTGMGKDLYESSPKVKKLFENSNDILGFRITDIMFEGSSEDLKQTKVTQPAVFIHSVAMAATLENFNPDMVAGHSLGEFSALVCAGAMSFEEGLRLVFARAMAMQKACEAHPSTMAAVLGIEDSKVEEICSKINGIVVPANYNCPGQLVISGTIEAVNEACTALKEAGAKRALVLPVGGAFHSPLMESARKELAEAIKKTSIKKPVCPIYQNVDALPEKNPEIIKEKLLMQLTSPVKWTQTIQNMHRDGATQFTELGPGSVLQGLIKKCLPDF
jgi:[acyl-carrier-protein] S-malonyltransferase